MQSSKRFVIVYLSAISPVFFILVFGVLFLRNMGEMFSDAEIAQRQQLDGALYGSALRNASPAYRFGILEARKPEVVIIGSSRALQFQQSMFTSSFANLGGTVGDLGMGKLFIRELLRRQPPKLLLFALDYWWFHQAADAPPGDLQLDKGGKGLTLDDLFAPVKWLAQGKVSFSQYFHGLATSSWKSFPPAYGVQAALNRDGFGPDGSRHYLGTTLGLYPSWDRQFADTLWRIAASQLQFKHCDSLRPEAMEQFRNILQILHESKVPVILFLPGMAPKVAARMLHMGAKYACIEKLRNHLSTMVLDGPEQRYFDFFDSENLKATDCEYIDGFHGGPTVSLRMLLVMSRESGAMLAGHVDREKLASTLKSAEGRTILPGSAFVRQDEREADFLELGCRK